MCYYFLSMFPPFFCHTFGLDFSSAAACLSNLSDALNFHSSKYSSLSFKHASMSITFFSASIRSLVSSWVISSRQAHRRRKINSFTSSAVALRLMGCEKTSFFFFFFYKNKYILFYTHIMIHIYKASLMAAFEHKCKHMCSFKITMIIIPQLLRMSL
jgi:hypothetical protein